MDCNAEYLSYKATGYFSPLVTDYLAGEASLQPFYSHPVSLAGIRAAIDAKKKHPVDRNLLVSELRRQYEGQSLTAKQQDNLARLANENTFTITTAHQPNIFTGHLYFVYKILHAIKLAAELEKEVADCHFVPVFYMGSEDADLDELGHVYLGGEKYEWSTNQTGAVGRMQTDAALLKMIDAFSGQLSVHPQGAALISLLRASYKAGNTIEQATFQLVNQLFGEYGLLLISPDCAALKKVFIPVVQKELDTNFSFKAVTETVSQFPATYKVQASGRELNLFYLEGNRRERIEQSGSGFSVPALNLAFDRAAILEELQQHPERFSANVILRPLFQEMILPNVAFIGGGGEIAYWLELKKVFEAAQVPLPVLVLRNSFLWIDAQHKKLQEKTALALQDLFRPENELLTELVKRETKVRLSLDTERQTLKDFYSGLKATAGAVDSTLLRHIEALQAQALKKLDAVEKKMLRAEKRKFEAQQRQLHKLKTGLFPGNGLQERTENFMPYYARLGNTFFELLYKYSAGLDGNFCVITEVDAA